MPRRTEAKVDDEIRKIVKEAIAGTKKAIRNPGEQLVIVASSPSWLTSSEDIHLMVDERGQIADAAISPDRVITSEMRERGFEDAASIDLDVTSAQYRTLKKFAASMEKTEALRPAARKPKKNSGTAMPHTNPMTKKQFEEDFRENTLPFIIERYEQDGVPDRPARCEAWNDTVDSYIKDGILSESAYNWSHPRWLETARRNPDPNPSDTKLKWTKHSHRNVQPFWRSDVGTFRIDKLPPAYDDNYRVHAGELHIGDAKTLAKAKAMAEDHRGRRGNKSRSNPDSAAIKRRCMGG